MKNYETNRVKMEKAINLLDEVNQLLFRILGEMDAVQAISFVNRGRFEIIEGGKAGIEYGERHDVPENKQEKG